MLPTLMTPPETSFHHRMTFRTRSALLSDGKMTALCSTKPWKTWRKIPFRYVSRLPCQYMMITVRHRALAAMLRRKFWRVARIHARRTTVPLFRPLTPSSRGIDLLIGTFFSKISFNAPTTRVLCFNPSTQDYGTDSCHRYKGVNHYFGECSPQASK